MGFKPTRRIESRNPNKQLADPRNIAPSELSRYKSACEALSSKITAALMDKPIPGGGPATDIEVQLSYKTDPDILSSGSGFYIHVVAKDVKGRNMISFGDYV